MFKFFTTNLIAKIFCLVLAFAAWIYVASGEAKVGNFPGSIALEIRNTPVDLVAITDVEKVQIKISADRSIWNKLSAETFSASVDLKGLSQGTYELAVVVNSTVKDLSIIEINPAKILLRLEPLSSKTVSVNTKIEGSAGEGLIPDVAEINPAEVEITGAESIINQILLATAVIRLDGETEDIKKKVKVVALDSENQEIKNVSFTPTEVEINLPIVKAALSKTVGIKAKIIGKPKSGLWVSSLTTDPTSVTISSTSGGLQDIDYLETSEINIEGIENNTTRTASFNIPSGVKIVDEIDKVKVQIELSASSSIREVIPGIVYENLASGLVVSGLTPAEIKTMVSGPKDLLATLSSSNVLLKINLVNYQEAGTYTLDIEKSMISLSDGVFVSSIVPSAIKIILEKK